MKVILLRGAMTLSLLASLLVMVISYWHVRPRFAEMIRHRDTLATRVNELSLAKTELETRLAKARAQLSASDVARAASQQREIELQSAVEQLSVAAAQREESLMQARRELARWSAIGEPPEKVSALVHSHRGMTQTMAKLIAQRDALMQKQAHLTPIATGSDGAPQMPPLQGSVLVVDPKWNFVVVDRGEADGLRERGVLMVRRGGNLIGKVRLTRVEAARSIGDILPEWQQAQIREGDEVLN